MHYQRQMDKIFTKGELWKHRTLRTLFDPNSSEYNQTSIDKKLYILETIKANNIDINNLILEYKEFYTEENKLHVVDVADSGLKILLEQENEKM